MGVPDAGGFPRAAWLRALRRGLAAVPDAALAHADPLGRPELRAALAAYLGRARGVLADPGRIVVTAGFTQGFALLCRALGPGTVALEDPCLHHLRDIARDTGRDVAALAVDERGATTPGEAAAALVTPAHQFPLGATLAPDRRAALVAWARERGAVVIEDDYDGEFRYDRQPVGALQGLDPEHVVYAGTASKTLAPGLRLGWLVLPERLVAPVVAARPLAGGDPPVLDQLALAGLLASGGFDRHVRRMRQRYRRRRDALLAVLAGRPTRGIAAGLHLVLDVEDEAEIARRRGRARARARRARPVLARRRAASRRGSCSATPPRPSTPTRRPWRPSRKRSGRGECRPGGPTPAAGCLKGLCPVDRQQDRVQRRRRADVEPVALGPPKHTLATTSGTRTLPSSVPSGS